MAAELDALTQALSSPKRPMVAIVAGSKVSTKLTILAALAKKVDRLVVGGGILACVVLVIGFAVLILSGAVRAPTIMTPGFFIVVVAMGYELSWDLFVAQRTAAQLRHSEAELQSSGERFRAVVEAAPNAMLHVDDREQISLANAQAESLFGLSRDVLVGSTVERLVPERERASHEAYRRGYSAEMQPRAMGLGRDVHALRSDGSEVPVEVSLKPL